MHIIKKVAAFALAGTMILSLEACGSTTASNSGSSSNGGNAEAGADVQIPNPFEDFSTLEQAEQAAGFEMSLPDAPDGYETVVYRVDADVHMLEVVYSDKALENEDAVEAYRIRKASESGNISGDYNEYSEVNEVAVSDNQVTLKGTDGKVFVATWASGEYSYAIDIDMNGQGLSSDDVIALVKATN